MKVWLFPVARTHRFSLRKIKTAPKPSLGAVLFEIDYADGGTRTRTALSGQRILSPLRLPFRHIGARTKANEAAHRWTGKRNFAVRIRRARSSARPDSGQSI
jgi:hypothetical protein